MKGNAINTYFKPAIAPSLPSLKFRPATFLLFGLACSLVLISGCSKGESETTAVAPAGDAVAAGKTLFASNNCMRCHTLNGTGGRMGPELTHVGAEAGKDQAWFAKFLKDPTSQNPRSRMPSFGHLGQKDLDNLGAYLASLK